jgi:hypothetical protein
VLPEFKVVSRGGCFQARRVVSPYIERTMAFGPCGFAVPAGGDRERKVGGREVRDKQAGGEGGGRERGGEREAGEGTHRSRFGKRVLKVPSRVRSTCGVKVPSRVPVLQRHRILGKGR